MQILLKYVHKRTKKCIEIEQISGENQRVVKTIFYTNSKNIQVFTFGVYIRKN